MQLFDVYPLYPIEIVKGEGSWVWDLNGVKYLDMYGGHAVISIGHSHPHYVNMIKEQLDKIGFYSNSVIISSQKKLADKIGRLSGKEDYQLFLCNSGAEANENALKLASFHTGRKKLISFRGAFHGRTSLAVAATDNPNIVAPINETDNIIFLPYNDCEALKNKFNEMGDQIAAVIVEGIQGVGGIIEASVDFLKTIRTMCDKYGSVYIADGVQCGGGRSGMYYSHDYAGVSADIYSMAKGIGNGFPIGAISIAPHIKPKYGMLGTTFGGNHLACAAAIAVADVIESEKLIEKSKEMGEYIKQRLTQIPNIKEVRGRGLMIGIELHVDSAPIRKQLVEQEHIFVGSASNKNVIRLLPSLMIDKASIDHALNALNKLLSQL